MEKTEINRHAIGTGFLAVDELRISNQELVYRVEAAAQAINSKFPESSADCRLAVIIDETIASQILLLALARLEINCAIIDKNSPEALLEKMFLQFNPTAVIAPKEISNKRHRAGIGFFHANEFNGEFVEGHGDVRVRSGSLVVFSSGSTGVPKGVIIKWDTIFEWVSMRESDWSKPNSGPPIILNMSPLSWLTGTLSVLAALKGATVHTISPLKYSLKELLEKIRGINPTILYLTSHFAEALAGAVENSKDMTQIETIEHLMVGGTSLSWETVHKLKPLIPETAMFMHPLGASEAFRMLVYSSQFNELPKTGKVPVGVPADPTNIKFVRDKLNEDVFEVVASGPIASGYLEENQTQAKFTIDASGKAWWASGDFVQLDPNTGHYLHVGRKDDYVKINDHNVSLTDVESALLAHPDVARAAVVTTDAGPRLRLIGFVEPRDLSDINQPRLMGFLRENLPPYSLPHLIVIDEEIPMTRSGKPDRPKLRQLANEMLAGSSSRYRASS